MYMIGRIEMHLAIIFIALIWVKDLLKSGNSTFKETFLVSEVRGNNVSEKREYLSFLKHNEALQIIPDLRKLFGIASDPSVHMLVYLCNNAGIFVA